MFFGYLVFTLIILKKLFDNKKKIPVLFFPKVPNEMIRNISTLNPKNRILQKVILFFEVKQPKDSGSLRYERVAERFSRMPSFLSGR